MVQPLSSVELRHLAALIAVGTEGSFSRAAESLGYTQSAVSQQVASLERRVGRRLVQRPGGPRAVSLTAAGEILARHGEQALEQIRAAQTEMAALEGHAPLRVGSYQSVGQQILPGVLQALAARDPHVQVLLTEDENDGNLLDLLRRGELDLTFGVQPLPDGPFEVEEVLRDPYVAVLPVGSAEFPGTGRVRPDELRDHPILAFGPMRREHLVEERVHIPADHVVFRSNDTQTLLGMVRSGLGIAVIPWLACAPDDPSVRVVPIEGVEPRSVGICWHEERRLSTESVLFMDATREVVRGLSGPEGYQRG